MLIGVLATLLAVGSGVIVGGLAGYSGGWFFFQAEDGIRDADVTGVQTCALPISLDVTSTAPTIGFGEVRPRPRSASSSARRMKRSAGSPSLTPRPPARPRTPVDRTAADPRSARRGRSASRAP